LADAYLGSGRAEEAIALLGEGDLGDPGVVLLLAEAHYQRGDAERALALLKPLAEAVRDQPAAAAREDERGLAGTIARAYGRVLVAAGRPAEAVPVLAKAVELRPQDPEAWQSYGQALAGAGRRDEAATALERFSELVKAAETTPAPTTAAGPLPENPRLREALHLLEIGHREKALEMARAEMAASSQDLWPRVLVVRILLMMGKPDEALPVAQETLQLAPDNPDAVYQRGAVQMARLAREDAESDFRRALQLAPNHVPAMNDLAVLLMLREANAEAQALLEKVLALKPDDVMASRNLQKLKERAAGG
jgi:Flp pilus assembly protein TadD